MGYELENILYIFKNEIEKMISNDACHTEGHGTIWGIEDIKRINLNTYKVKTWNDDEPFKVEIKEVKEHELIELIGKIINERALEYLMMDRTRSAFKNKFQSEY